MISRIINWLKGYDNHAEIVQVENDYEGKVEFHYSGDGLDLKEKMDEFMKEIREERR